MFSDNKFYFRYPGEDMELAMKMWERESSKHSPDLTSLFIELLHMILFEKNILLEAQRCLCIQ